MKGDAKAKVLYTAVHGSINGPKTFPANLLLQNCLNCHFGVLGLIPDSNSLPSQSVHKSLVGLEPFSIALQRVVLQSASE